MQDTPWERGGRISAMYDRRMGPPLDDAVVKRRYEGIYRAIARRSLLPVVVCVGTTAVVAYAFVTFALPLVIPLIPFGTPAFIAIASTLAILLAGITVLPTLAQLVLTSRSWRKAVEALNGWAMFEQARLRSLGIRPPLIFGRGSARRWIARTPGIGGPMRIRYLAWIGELNAAAEITAHMPTETPAARFERRLLQAMIEFVATGTADLSAAREELAAVPAGAERDSARLALAFEEARLVHAAGGDWVPTLAAARDDISVLPKGASIRERFIASLPTYVGIMALSAALGWVLG